MASGSQLGQAHKCRTYPRKSCTSFTWHLEDYSTLQHFYSDECESPKFEIFNTNKKCNLMYYVCNDDLYAYIVVYFPADVEFSTLKITCSIIDENNQKIVTKTHICTEVAEEYSFSMVLGSEILKKKKFLHDDTLRLLCEIVIVKDVNHASIETITQGRCVDTDVHKKFEEFHDDGSFFDVTLSVQDIEFRAHKVILASASPVFEAMFKTNMTEQADNIVKIIDIDAEAFRAFLKSIYSSSIDTLEKNVREILIIADKYQVLHVKKLCEKYIINHINAESVIRDLLLGHSHGFDVIKQRALSVAIINRKLLTNSAGFTELCNFPELLTEIFEKIAGTEEEEKVEDAVKLAPKKTLAYRKSRFFFF